MSEEQGVQGGTQILLIEDEPQLRRFLLGVLHCLGPHFAMSRSGLRQLGAGGGVGSAGGGSGLRVLKKCTNDGS